MVHAEFRVLVSGSKEFFLNGNTTKLSVEFRKRWMGLILTLGLLYTNTGRDSSLYYLIGMPGSEIISYPKYNYYFFITRFLQFPIKVIHLTT